MRAAFLLALLLALAAVALPASAQKAGAEGVDLSNLLSKLPAVVPFMKTKVRPDCGNRLEKFAAEFEEQKPEKQTMENRTLRQALCDVGFDCTSEVVTLLSTFVKGGGMMAKMAQGLMGNKIDIENIDTMVLAYYANMCDELDAATTTGGSKATKEQEL